MKKVHYRRPDTHKTVPAFVLCDNGELTLLFVPRSAEGRPDFILMAQDEDGDGVYEDAEANWFNVSSGQAQEVATNLKAVSSRRPEAQNERLPLVLKCPQARFAQNLHQRGVARGVALSLRDEPVIKLHQQPFLLEVIAEVTGLGIMLAVAVTPIKLRFRHRRELLK